MTVVELRLESHLALEVKKIFSVQFQEQHPKSREIVTLLAPLYSYGSSTSSHITILKMEEVVQRLKKTMYELQEVVNCKMF